MTIQDRIFLAFIPLFLLIGSAAVFFIYSVNNSNNNKMNLSNCLAYMDGKSGKNTLGEIYIGKNSFKIIMPSFLKKKNEMLSFKKKIKSRVFINKVIRNGGFLRDGGFFIFLKKRKEGYSGVFGFNNKQLSGDKLLLSYIFTIAVWGLIIVMIISMYISRRLSRPLKRISDHFKLQTADGTYNEIDHNMKLSSDEIKVLAESYNKLILTLKSLSDASLKNERLVVMGQMTAEMAHEIRNPLNAMAGAVEILKGDGGVVRQAHQPVFGDGGVNKYLKVIEDKIARIDAFIKETLMFSRENKTVIEKVELQNVINEIADYFKPIIEKKSIKLIINDFPDLPAVAMTYSHAYQIISNIIENAINAAGDAGEITLRTGLIDHHYLCLEIHDNGPGIKKEDLKRIFEPFFGVGGKGSGLGLAIVKRLIEEYGGRVEASNSDSMGSVFKLNFPLYL
ncbi:MAG: HAMP domain-containing histidine kinase [Spirochaetes bacterium]|nr:HAMP domain-containing histidine kinase [Spirochaetota bacterium]